MLEVGKCYKHERCTDVAIYVTVILNNSEKSGLKTKVYWVNVAQERHHIISLEEITIKPQDLKRWKEFKVNFNE